MRTLAMAVIAVLAIQTAQAQFYTIADGYVAACTGALLDSGGEGASGYSDNENYTMYICPDGSGGPGISLQWLTFNLSTAGPLPIDQLAIYDGLLDGVNPDPPLLGIYDGNNPPSITSASFENVQNTVNGGGCLTLVFTSNATGTGVFAAAISCFAPCEPPTASATVGAATPLYVCQGEPVTFDGNASVAASPFNIVEYNWDFDNGETDNSGPVVTHSFDEPGEYVVQLYVTDDNDCVNTNRTDLAIWVSTTPNFSNITPNTTICEGEQVPLTVDVEAVTWADLPGSNLGDGIFLPDDQGVPFTSTITFSSFAPGQTLENIDDLLSVCVDMEHSFMGDLVVQLTCPSGQTVTMHQQGGGGTFLGEAVDDESQPDVQGVCWNYCWSPTATNGTWVDNSGNGSPLASGTYESVNPMDVLVGCQLNGTWTFTITDLWAIDNGFLCNWGLNFDGSLFPELTSFTPVLGVSTADSASWQGNGVALDPQNPLQGVATPVGVGEYDYVFSVTDNFGCTYDTSFVITVNPGIQGPINITGNNTICDGSIAYLNAPPGFGSYTWSNGSFGQNISAGEGTYTVTVANGDCSLQSEPFTVTAQPSPQPVIDGPGFSCGGELSVLSTLESYSSYTWSNGGNTPTISVGTGTYSVTVTNAAGCSGVSQQFVVVVGSDPQAAYSTDPVSPQGIGTTVAFTDLSQGNGSPIVGWDWSLGLAGATSTDPSPSITYVDPGEYPVTLTVTTADGCTSTIAATFVILPEDIIIPNVFTPNGDGNNEYFEIENGQYYENTLQVFNRWGQEVFEAKNYRNGWRANDLPDGTYYYVFTTIRDGKEYTGHVTILR